MLRVTALCLKLPFLERIYISLPVLWVYSIFSRHAFFFLLPCMHVLQCINLTRSLFVAGLRRYGSRSSSRTISFRVSQQERLPLLVVKRCKSLPCRCDNAFGKQADQTATKRYSVVAPESTGLWGDKYVINIRFLPRNYACIQNILLHLWQWNYKRARTPKDLVSSGPRKILQFKRNINGDCLPTSDL